MNIGAEIREWWKGFWSEADIQYTKNQLQPLITYLQARGYTATAQKLIEAQDLVETEHFDPDRRARQEAFRAHMDRFKRKVS